MRHSRAVASDFQTSDSARWLSQSGRDLARQAGVALAELGGIECIVTSPLVRAVQTAEIVASCLGWQGEIRSLASLRSEMSPEDAVADLQSLASEAVLAVSHEPIVSAMSALLCGARAKEFRGGFNTAEVRAFRGESLIYRFLG